MNEIFNNTYRNKKVFVTGHTGFKGSWLTSWLLLLGAEVRGFSLAPKKEQNLFDSLSLEKKIDSLLGDIRNKKLFEKSICEFQPDFIFHLAAQPLVRESYKNPLETYETNVLGTGNLVYALNKLDKKCTVIIITTDKVYENKEWNYPYRENDRLGGYDPYSSSKACCEILVDSFRNSFFNQNSFNTHKKAIATARAGNVIGGGDWSDDRIIPDIVRALEKNENIPVRNPIAVRPWQHVIEPLAGYLLLGSLLEESPNSYSSSWNFGPSSEDALPVLDLVKKSIDCWGSGSYKVLELENQPHEAGLLKLDINKAINELGWKPKFSSEQAIQMSINWYKNYNLGEDPIKLVELDLNSYINY